VRPSSPSPWAVFAVASVAIFMVSLDGTMLYVAFPAIQRSFPDVVSADLSWILNAYTVLFGAAVVPSGRLADRIGRRAAFITGVAIFTLASAACAMTPSPALLIAARGVQAIGAALAVPSSLALVLASFPRDKRSIAISLWGAVAALSAAIGPALGSFVIERLSWHWAFWLNVPVGIACVAAVRRVATESKDPANGRLPDPLGLVLIVGAVGAVALGTVQGNEWGWTSAKTFGALGAGAALFAAFWIQTVRSTAPVVDLALFETRNFRYANVGTFVYSIAFAAMFFGMVLFMTRVWGMTIMQSGLGATPGPLAVIPVAIFGGRYAATHGHRSLLVVGGLIFTAGTALLAFGMTAEPAYVSRFLPAAIITGAGVGLVLPSLTASSAHGLPDDRFALGSAVNQALRQLGGTLGVALTFAILEALPGAAGFEALFVVVAAGGVATSLLSLTIDTRPLAEPHYARAT
jgi:EmrB/QacA subfamily drug resistance transporter